MESISKLKLNDIIEKLVSVMHTIKRVYEKNFSYSHAIVIISIQKKVSLTNELKGI